MGPNSANALFFLVSTLFELYMGLLLLRVILSLYFVASALATHDARRLSPIEIGLRLAVSALILFKPLEVYGPAMLAWVVIMVEHYLRARRLGGSGDPAGGGTGDGSGAIDSATNGDGAGNDDRDSLGDPMSDATPYAAPEGARPEDLTRA